MKILFMSGYPRVYAGSQIQLFELLKHLPDSYETRILLTEDQLVAQRYRVQGLPVTILNPGGTLNTFGKQIQKFSKLKLFRIFMTDYLSYSRRLIRFLRQEKFDCVHCNDPRAVILMALAAKWTRTQMICQLHTDQGISPLFWRLFQVLSTKIAVISKAAFQDLTESSQKKAAVIYPGVPSITLNTSNLHPVINQIKGKEGVLIGIFSTLIPFKGYHHLLEAMRAMKERSLEQKWHIISLGGSPEEYAWYQKWIQELVKEYGLEEHITFLGWQSNPYNYMNACDVVVLPSIKEEVLRTPDRTEEVVGSEGFPTVVLEAMYLGKAVIATNVAGVPEQITHEEEGLLIEPSSSKDLEQSLVRLLHDQALRIRLGQQAQQKAKTQFSGTSYATGFQKIYENLR
ncbi:MAG: glycosyltransferase family 4 protein [Bacteroidota bacterium]